MAIYQQLRIPISGSVFQPPADFSGNPCCITLWAENKTPRAKTSPISESRFRILPVCVQRRLGRPEYLALLVLVRKLPESIETQAHGYVEAGHPDAGECPAQRVLPFVEQLPQREFETTPTLAKQAEALRQLQNTSDVQGLPIALSQHRLDPLQEHPTRLLACRLRRSDSTQVSPQAGDGQMARRLV